ncbi:MAG: GTP-binding protein Era [Brockia lithotrophica]|uniref:GTPase Era n=1 Tax=Brockia lithotrophica TaxID=933949 RepID=A0A2T5G705_9BACL|nr:MAG: GTP-binding protein Era [Brockia lithotrophica]
MNAPETKRRSGFAAVVGRPNVGKSTLVNAVVGSKVAIVTPKPQTTRHNVRGVYTEARGQIVFVDTPGIHRPRSKLGEWMNESARRVLRDVDLVLFVIDAARGWTEGDARIAEELFPSAVPVIAVLNKIDALTNRALVLPLIERVKDAGEFREIVPVSALRGDGLDRLVDLIFAYLPEGPYFFPPDVLSDRPEAFHAAEIIREKILLFTEEEVPHAVDVQIESWEETEGLLSLAAVVTVEREGQKAILIGRGGSKLKEIGTAARRELEERFGRKVFLKLWVRVRERWRDRPTLLREFGYRDT